MREVRRLYLSAGMPPLDSHSGPWDKIAISVRALLAAASARELTISLVIREERPAVVQPAPWRPSNHVSGLCKVSLWA